MTTSASSPAIVPLRIGWFVVTRLGRRRRSVQELVQWLEILALPGHHLGPPGLRHLRAFAATGFSARAEPDLRDRRVPELVDGEAELADGDQLEIVPAPLSAA